jgi:Cyclic nucleotide-binding domain
MSVSWIPSEAIRGTTRLPFDMGITHYDDPPPDHIDDIDTLHRAGSFRFANVLRAWVDIEDGEIAAVGQDGGGLISSTLVKLGRLHLAFQPTAFPDLRPEPEWGPQSARFVQTAGGRPGVPAPRRVAHAPFMQLKGPTVWTTLALTINADGTTAFELAGASPFPRHWLYDDDGELAAKAGLIDFKDWYVHAFGSHSPWGDEDSPAMTTTVESALERQLASTIMRGGAAPRFRNLEPGERLVEQGEPGDELFLVLDGMVVVTVDGEQVAEFGPGAIMGERAILEGGRRTSTITATTKCRVAVARAADVDRDALATLSADHRKEDGR